MYDVRTYDSTVGCQDWDLDSEEGDPANPAMQFFPGYISSLCQDLSISKYYRMVYIYYVFMFIWYK